jgi:SAM-dependent methyltransferase
LSDSDDRSPERALRWESDTELTVGETRFQLANWAVGRSNRDRFMIGKHRPMVERLASLVGTERPRAIFELGIFQGGSTALLAALADPRKLVAIDRSPDPVVPLERFVAERGMEEQVRTYYGVDQSDRARLGEILDAEFGDEPLDLVVDDASHLLHETRTSFNLLFPRLRPGGVFVLEDWSWAHVYFGPHEGIWPERTPLTVLLFELLLACASPTSGVEEVSTFPDMAFVRRSTAPLDPDEFDISTCYGDRGRDLIAPQ